MALSAQEWYVLQNVPSLPPIPGEFLHSNTGSWVLNRAVKKNRHVAQMFIWFIYIYIWRFPNIWVHPNVPWFCSVDVRYFRKSLSRLDHLIPSAISWSKERLFSVQVSRRSATFLRSWNPPLFEPLKFGCFEMDPRNLPKMVGLCWFNTKNHPFFWLPHVKKTILWSFCSVRRRVNHEKKRSQGSR